MIIVGGESLIDLIQAEQQSFTAKPGGSPFNTAKALARLGHDVGYLTPISTDTLGQVLADDLASDGISLLADRSSKPTALAVVTLDNGQAQYQFYRTNTADRDISTTMLNRIIPKATTGFHVGSLGLTSGKDAKAWAQMFVALHKRGVFTSVDPNIRAGFIKNRSRYLSRLSWIFEHADLIKLSDEDIAWLSPDQPIEMAAQALFDQSTASVLVLTKGSEGALGFYQGGQIQIPAAPVKNLKDTVGAGDTFMGALIARIFDQGLDKPGNLEQISARTLKGLLEDAAKAAAYNCESSGCNPPERPDIGL